MMTGPSEFSQFDRQLVVIGGCGHIGLPLGIAFADRGARVGIYDVSEFSVEMVNPGRLPFAEPGADEILPRVVAAGLLPLAEVMSRSDLLVIGAPHPEYTELATGKPVADIWNVLGLGVRV
jgi:UDP-N-acetyl-D-mannosaminuronic acid dehydrogenase